MSNVFSKFMSEQRKQKIKFFFEKQKKELIKNKNIVLQLVKRNIKVQYRNSAIGILWTVLNPLLNMLVMYFVFSTIFGYDDPTYSLYLLCGNIVFNTMRAATTQSLTSLVGNRGLLTKNKIAYAVFPLSCNLSAIVNFAFSFIALVGVMVVVALAYNVRVFSVNMFMTLVMIPALFLFCFGISLFLSALYVFFRDIMHFYNVFLTLWMYLTPIFYKTDNLGTGFKDMFILSVIKLNPMYHYIEYFRAIIYGCASGTMSFPSGMETLTLYLIGIITTVVGLLFFDFTKHRFIFNI